MPIRRLPQLALPLDGNGRLHAQLYRALHQHILNGDLQAGSRLPSTRVLAEDLAISRTTTQLAYDQLIAEGYLETRKGSGTYVLPQLKLRIPLPRRTVSPVTINWSSYGRYLSSQNPFFETNEEELTAAMEPGLITNSANNYDLRYGLPDQNLFPTKEWNSAYKAAISGIKFNDPRIRGAEGMPDLRRAIADYLQRNRGIFCHPGQVVVTTGSQQSLQVLIRILCDAGDQMLVEDPCYPFAKVIAESEQIGLVMVPVDRAGIDINKVGEDKTYSPSGSKLVYVTPSHQFPLGSVLSFERRQALIQWAKSTEAFIIEDDYDGEFRYSGAPLESMLSMDDSGRVIYLGSFSKTLSPALKIGYMVLPPTLTKVAIRARWHMGGYNANIEQQALATLLGNGHYDKHVRRSRLIYAKRRNRLSLALNDFMADEIDVWGDLAGLHLTVWFKSIAFSQREEFFLLAKTHNLQLSLINNLYARPPAQLGLALGYGMIEEDFIEEAIETLWLCVKQFRQ